MKLKNEIPLTAAGSQCDLPHKPSFGFEVTILLVEDETFVRTAAIELLKAAHYNVIVAKNGEEAVDICRESLRAIDLLLTDLILPGMSGRVLAEQFSKIFPRGRVLLMTGYNEQLSVHPLPAGETCLAKPFSAADLLGRIREAVPFSSFEVRQ
jgi:two-component system, cell cycle sensor histidine kinase and response regulator CckA